MLPECTHLGLQRHQAVKHGVVQRHESVQAAVEVGAQLHVTRDGGGGQTRLQRARLARLGEGGEEIIRRKKKSGETIFSTYS